MPIFKLSVVAGLVAVAGIVNVGNLGNVGSVRDGEPNVTRQPFGTTKDGTPVEQFTLTNTRGLEVRAMTYGAVITSIRVPDRTGAIADIALGFDTLEGYLGAHPFFGAVVGRYGNRIANARFTLGGRTYQLAANDGANH